MSFIETGRARPSREAVPVLAEALDVLLRERNRLLEAAGFARMFRETPLTSDEMTHLRASGRLLSMLAAPPLLTRGANLFHVVFHPEGVRRWIVNWAEVEFHIAAVQHHHDFGRTARCDASGTADRNAPSRGRRFRALLGARCR